MLSILHGKGFIVLENSSWNTWCLVFQHYGMCTSCHKPSHNKQPHSCPGDLSALSRNRRLKRTTTKSCYRTALAYLWQLLESSPDILKPDQDGCPPAEDRLTTSRPERRTVAPVDLSANGCSTFLPLASWHCAELWHCGCGKVGRTGNTYRTRVKSPSFSLLKIKISIIAVVCPVLPVVFGRSRSFCHHLLKSGDEFERSNNRVCHFVVISMEIPF